MAIMRYIEAASYLFGRTPRRLEKPIVIQFPVIDICNSRCQMCRIWENKRSNDIAPEELRRGLRNALYSEVTSVGLSGGEPTLRTDLAQLVEVLFDEIPRLQYISLITNAFNSRDVISRIQQVGAVVRKNNGRLDVMVSLDGCGDVHDRVRGKPGGFQSAQLVLDALVASPLVQNLRIGCTIVKENVHGLPDLLEYCQSRGLHVKYRLGIPHQRLYTQDLIAPYLLTAEETYHVAEFLEGLIKHYEPDERQRFFYRSLIDQILHNAPRKAGCDWQHRGVTITSKGELLYCAVQSRALGTITEDDSERIYFDNEPHLLKILHDSCATCRHDYMGLPPRNLLARRYAARALRKAGVDSFVRKLLHSTAVGKARRRRQYEARLAALKRLRTQGDPPTGRAQANIQRVLICGWYGTETLGDKAILGGVIEALRSALGAVEFTLASLHPYVSDMTRKQMPELKEVRIVTPRRAIEGAGGMDLVAFGGGPLMALEELAEMEALFDAARRCSVRTLIAGCGVGPLGDSWHNNSLSRVLSAASVRIYRDSASHKLAGRLGVDTSADLVAEDPAFTWLEGQRAHLLRAPPTDHRVLLLGLRAFPCAQYARHLPERDCLRARARYEREVVAALEQLVSRNVDLVIRPLPMCTNHFGDDDRWFYRRLFRGNAKLPARLDLSLLGAELPPAAYCEAFATAHVALTMRFHSVVFALGLGVPTVAIDYTLGQGKVHALAERFGVPVQSLADLDAPFIVEQVERLMSCRSPQLTGFVPSFTGQVAKGLARIGREHAL